MHGIPHVGGWAAVWSVPVSRSSVMITMTFHGGPWAEARCTGGTPARSPAATRSTTTISRDFDRVITTGTRLTPAPLRGRCWDGFCARAGRRCSRIFGAQPVGFLAHPRLGGPRGLELTRLRDGDRVGGLDVLGGVVDRGGPE